MTPARGGVSSKNSKKGDLISKPVTKKGVETLPF